MEREWLCYGGGQFIGGNGHVREVVSFMEGSMVMLQRWSL